MKKMITSILLVFTTLMNYAQSPKEILYVGTFSVRGSEGIYVYELDRQAKKFNLVQSVKALESPSFLALHPSGKFLYSVNRGTLPERANSGSVSAYAIDANSGKLTLLNHKPSYGNGPCHISIDESGKLAFISNYTEGNFVVLRIEQDGMLGECSDSVRYSGNSVNKARQDKPHIHSATLSPDNRFVVVADLGTDKVYTYSFDATTGRLTPAQKPFAEVKPGAGPRHFAFHPNAKYAYLAEELTSSMCVFSYDKKTGALQVIQDDVKSLPENFTGVNSSADIHVDPSGRYVMMSNRGHQAVAVFAIDKKGKITYKESIASKGEKPRNFLIDDKNQFVLVAHQDTDNIVFFDWNAKTGKLSATETEIKVPSPVCLKMLTIK